jgi:hypothetical protein
MHYDSLLTLILFKLKVPEPSFLMVISSKMSKQPLKDKEKQAINGSQKFFCIVMNLFFAIMEN